MNTTLYHYLATSNSFPAPMVRNAKRFITNIYLPLPAFLGKALLFLFLSLRTTYYFLMRVFFCEPMFKAYCSKVGKNFHTAAKLHWVSGKGSIEIGDDVLLSGKSSFNFAARYSANPLLVIGDHCDVGHRCRFVIGKQITIGNHVMIGQEVNIRDINGHPVNAEARRNDEYLESSEVRPVVIEDDVWIGTGSTIGPGISIGIGSVIAANSVIYSNVPPYSIMGGNPARKMGSTQETSD